MTPISIESTKYFAMTHWDPINNNRMKYFRVKYNMASLVADYGASSESDDNSDQSENATDSVEDKKNEPQQSTNFFGGDAQDSDSEEEEEEESQKSSSSISDVNKLPNPFLTGSTPNPLTTDKALPSPALAGPGSNSDITGRVFLTQYSIAEANRSNILQQHVKMTQVEERQTSRKICHNFMRGTCRYGKKCKYTHGAPLPPQTEISQEPVLTDNPPQDYSYYGNQGGAGETETVADEDSYMDEAKRKKRHGVTNNMNPAKKAKKVLDAERRQERPWTTQT